MNTKSNSDRLGEEPIAKLLLRLSVPWHPIFDIKIAWKKTADESKSGCW
jgi:hypothetical protein